MELKNKEKNYLYEMYTSYLVTSTRISEYLILYQP
jgi:hypothetical protein